MKNVNETKILLLRAEIVQKLTPLIDDDYALLDVPDHDNIGDNLIWAGELNFLAQLPHKKVYEASYRFFQQKKIKPKTVILFHGGGNFGDIYKKTHFERLKIISENHSNKVLIFPQTIYYQQEKNIIDDAKIINAHPNLIICVRDLPSKKLADKYFYNSTVILLPDMAFCIDLDFFKTNKYGGKTLLMERKDAELKKTKPSINGDYEIFDWPTFNLSKEKRWKKLRYNGRLDKVATYLLKIAISSFVVDSRFGLKSKNSRERYVALGIGFFNNYQTIYTTRLHGLILGVLMGKDMKVLDNSYGKLTAFYDAWLKDFENVEVIRD